MVPALHIRGCTHQSRIMHLPKILLTIVFFCGLSFLSAQECHRGNTDNMRVALAPDDSAVNLRVRLTEASPLMVRIYNEEGEEIMRRRISEAHPGYRMRFPLRYFTPGPYRIIVSSRIGRYVEEFAVQADHTARRSGN